MEREGVGVNSVEVGAGPPGSDVTQRLCVPCIVAPLLPCDRGASATKIKWFGHHSLGGPTPHGVSGMLP